MNGNECPSFCNSDCVRLKQSKGKLEANMIHPLIMSSCSVVSLSLDGSLGSWCSFNTYTSSTAVSLQIWSGIISNVLYVTVQHTLSCATPKKRCEDVSLYLILNKHEPRSSMIKASKKSSSESSSHPLLFPSPQLSRWFIPGPHVPLTVHSHDSFYLLSQLEKRA